METPDRIAQELQRHQRNRRAGATIVSLFVGEPPAIERQLIDTGLGIVTTHALTPHAMAASYAQRVRGDCELVETALVALERLGTSSARGEWTRRSDVERLLWLDQVLSHPLPAAACSAAQWLRDRLEGAVPLSPTRECALLAEWRVDLPMLLVMSAVPEALDAAVALVVQVPELPVAATVPAESLAEVLNALPPRTRAILHEGLILSSANAVQRPQSAVAGTPASHGAPRIRQVAAATSAPPHTTIEARDPIDGAEAPPLPALREAARTAYRRADEQPNPHSPEADRLRAQANSMVEALLFQRLQRSRATRDVFELNALLPFKFGPRQLEADFASRKLRLVLEVDGYYHFRDPDAYRRDRRKDLLLQQHGYLVARFLADDVLERIDTVQREIEQLVLKPRHHASSEED